MKIQEKLSHDNLERTISFREMVDVVKMCERLDSSDELKLKNEYINKRRLMRKIIEWFIFVPSYSTWTSGQLFRNKESTSVISDRNDRRVEKSEFSPIFSIAICRYLMR